MFAVSVALLNLLRTRVLLKNWLWMAIKTISVFSSANVVMTLNKNPKSDVYKVELVPSRASLCQSVKKANSECTCNKPPAAEWLKNLKNVFTVKMF